MKIFKEMESGNEVLGKRLTNNKSKNNYVLSNRKTWHAANKNYHHRGPAAEAGGGGRSVACARKSKFYGSIRSGSECDATRPESEYGRAF
jgi:hypothetical protein